MSAVSRREFGTIMLAGVPAGLMFGASHLAAAAPVVLGVTTYSFRDLPRVTGRDNVDDVIAAVKRTGATTIALALSHIEPAPPSVGSFVGGSAAYPQRVTLSPEQIAATNAGARQALRTWRLGTPMAAIDAARAKLAAAGLRVHACTVSYDDSFTDAEIEATILQAKALGVSRISSPLTMAMAARLAPFAERHLMTVAAHTQVDGNKAGWVAGSQIREVLALSPRMGLTLDIGNLTASNRDAVADLRAHHTRVSHVVLKDRLRNGGASQPFGEGDSPIDAVLSALHGLDHAVPAFVEYDYIGLRSAVDEVKASVAYATRSLE